jgi:hypothetical protein
MPNLIIIPFVPCYIIGIPQVVREILLVEIQIGHGQLLRKKAKPVRMLATNVKLAVCFAGPIIEEIETQDCTIFLDPDSTLTGAIGPIIESFDSIYKKQGNIIAQCRLGN